VLSWWGRSDNPGVATHFVIGRDGSILQSVPLDNVAWHAGSAPASSYTKYNVPRGMNYYSIGIEMIHVSGNLAYPYTEAQLKALDRLITYIDSYYGKQGTIIDHKAWRPGNSDTSPEFAKYLASYQTYRSYKAN
jgi:N-acetyl-anhydromuramyl-L-alanine amidase AmpD